MLASIPSATVFGIDGHQVTVEVHVSGGVPGFTIVGLPDASVREARDRVRAAMMSSKASWPQKRITVNLAPTGVRKVGASLDLAIALGVLVADGQVPAAPATGLACFGELGLDGAIRPVTGAISLAAARRNEPVVVPRDNYAEATLIARDVRPIAHLRELLAVLVEGEPWPDPPPVTSTPMPVIGPDLANVRGQPFARTALEVAAAGGHHLLMIGPPGAGKTMLARCMPSLLPPLSTDDSLVATRIHSAAGVGLPPDGLVRRPPFRAPHHGASSVSLVGGGTHAVRPGEISLAHGGVLFLDELGEFHPAALDALRQPLEEGVVRVSRARASVEFPARFLLVAAMNPCPCGAPGGPGSCRCSDASRARYYRRVSGPLLDRFDLRIEVQRPATADLLGGPLGEPSEAVAARVAYVRDIARLRGAPCNSMLSSEALDEYAACDRDAKAVLERALTNGRLSARGYNRVRAVARTVADLDGHDGALRASDVLTALELRTTLRAFESEVVNAS